jgi:hypothetical protein
MGFFDLLDRYASLNAKTDPLVKIDALVPWEEFRLALGRVWRKPDSERGPCAGRKPMGALLTFKRWALSALDNLTGDQIEYQVRGRPSVVRFLGLSLGDRVPRQCGCIGMRWRNRARWETFCKPAPKAAVKQP